MSVLMIHPEWGVYLGCAMGFGFWSKLDSCGQDAAVAFDDEAQAREHIASWDNVDAEPEYARITFLPVVADRFEQPHHAWATMQACVAAGVDPWFDEWMPPANKEPA